MALQFEVGKFEFEYKPSSSRNWEIPKSFPPHPCQRTGATKIISNDRGHLLPDVKRPKTSPWGDFKSTWQYPRRITRDYIKKLEEPKLKRIKLWAEQCKRKPVIPLPDYALTRKEIEARLKTENPDTTIREEEKPSEIIESKPKFDNEPVIETMKYYEEGRTYCPGDYTKPENRHESYEALREQVRPLLPDNDSDRIVKPDHYCIHEHCIRPIDESCPPQIVNAIQNFETAKQFHKENLEHHPLPETVTDVKYRKLQMERKRNPGLALENEPYATGVGYKGFGAPGPTQCTKMKVYRPKTCTMSKESQMLESGKCRPNTARIIQLKEVTPMQLALCWDVIPENPKDEPKPPTHIDGSNGSAAPAVFTMVYSPKLNKNQETDTGEDQHYLLPSCDNPEHNAGSVFNKREDHQQRTSSNKSRTKEEFFRVGSKYKHENEICCHVKQMKISEDKNNNNENGKNGNRNSAEDQQNLKTTRPSTYHYRTPTSSNSSISICGDKSKLLPRQKLTPNKFLSRPCMACEMKGRLEEKRTKPDYKSAFKAGTPNSIGSASNSSGNSSNLSPGKVQIHVPKQRNPYAKRNYQIGTLAPPFSLRPGKHGCDYPEHWRLASIYQHSYKPIELRKRPLLTNVYL